MGTVDVIRAQSGHAPWNFQISETDSWLAAEDPVGQRQRRAWPMHEDLRQLIGYRIVGPPNLVYTPCDKF
jgi:hypothetical protein